MQEWLLLMVVAVSPMVHEDRFSSREGCQAAGRQWYAEVAARPDYRKQCRPSGMIDRCKFVCVSASGANP